MSDELAIVLRHAAEAPPPVAVLGSALNVRGREMSAGRVLIVEDEPDSAEVMGDRLESWGFEVEIVHNARACYAAMGEAAPDLVLLDLQMPDISGLDALVTLRSNHPQVPVLIVSASTAPDTVAKTMDRGAAGFLLKPYQVADLRQKVAQSLGRSF